MARHLTSFALCLVGLACGAGASPDVVPETSVAPVRLAPPDSAVSCVEWVRRAQANPDLDVTKVAEPRAYDPPPIPRRVPSSAYDKAGKAEVRVTVIVDTLGKADMSTFAVAVSTSSRLSASVKAAVAKWTFAPAEINGCKVPRRWKWGAVATRPRR